MAKTIAPVRLDISRFKREFSRLSKMTTYQRAMDKAIDIKADKWLSYVPLTKEQLFDIPHLDRPMTIIKPYGDGKLAPARSTYNGDVRAQRSIVGRPTEAAAILHAQGYYVIDSDFVVIRQEPNKQVRWCIICRTHHDIADFKQNKRYLNNLSFACKRSLEDGKRGIWRKAA